MKTFTQQVQDISAFLVLPGEAPAPVSRIAKRLKVNDSTLRNALKSDTPESPYTGALAAVVLEAWKLVPVKKEKKEKKAPARGRLHGLVRVTDSAWTASLGDEKLSIEKREKEWVAMLEGGKKIIAQATTFKGIIAELRTQAAAA